MNAAQILTETRDRAGLTLRELAALAGTSHATLSAYEHGRVVPRVDTLERILHAAGFALDTDLVRRRRDGFGGNGARGDELIAALRLAATFPARPKPTLDCPPFRRR